jgi:hypothetical protein
MSSPAPHEIANAVASVVAAIGGAFAAVAAFRSAASAREAAKSAKEMEHRSLLREISGAATAVRVAATGVASRGTELHVEYQAAEAFSGSFDHSSFKLLRAEAEALVSKAQSLIPNAELFSNGAKSLLQAPAEELDRVHVKLSEDLLLLHAIREELDRKYIAIAAQNAQQREARLQQRR